MERSGKKNNRAWFGMEFIVLNYSTLHCNQQQNGREKWAKKRIELWKKKKQNTVIFFVLILRTFYIKTTSKTRLLLRLNCGARSIYVFEEWKKKNFFFLL